jgi:prevent-host-death family protein
MPESVNVYQAKTHFSQLLDRAEAGDEIVIARAGRPVARLVPLARSGRQRVPGTSHELVGAAADIDDGMLSRAAAKLGTTTKKDTVNRALELAAADTEADERDRRRFRDFVDRSAARMAQIDWDQAWH